MEPAQNFWDLRKYLLVSLLAIFLGLVLIYVTSPMLVTVSGVGEVSVPATNATVTFTLAANDANPQGAISNVNARALAMRSYLAGKGIAETDIAESQVTTSPLALAVAGATGFQSVITMAAKTTSVSDISTLVAGLYANGAAIVSQPILTVENQEDLEDQALELALADAKEEAKVVGLMHWKFFRKVIAVSQASSGSSSTATTKADTTTAASDAVAAQNGVFKIVKAVSVGYKMW